MPIKNFMFTGICWEDILQAHLLFGGFNMRDGQLLFTVYGEYPDGLGEYAHIRGRFLVYDKAAGHPINVVSVYTPKYGVSDIMVSLQTDPRTISHSTYECSGGFYGAGVTADVYGGRTYEELRKILRWVGKVDKVVRKHGSCTLPEDLLYDMAVQMKAVFAFPFRMPVSGGMPRTYSSTPWEYFSPDMSEHTVKAKINWIREDIRNRIENCAA